MVEKIKFIACDMDGTLLDNNHQLPNDFYDVFAQLQQQQVLFAAASGRQYFSLLNTFTSVADKMIFIAENGSFVMHQGKELYSATIELADVHRVITCVRSIADCHIVLCGKKSAYTETSDEKALAEIKNYYHHLQNVTDLLAVEDQYIKIAVLNFNGSEACVYPVVSEQFSDTHQVVVSAKVWLDVMNKEASKGAAIKHLQKTFDFSFQQSMSFGDYFNDIEMLKETYHSYAMENAHAEIKKLARFSAPSNEHCGVTQVIKDKVLGKN